jgi:hypothetical protein
MVKHTEDERLCLKGAHELKTAWCDYVMKIPCVCYQLLICNIFIPYFVYNTFFGFISYLFISSMFWPLLGHLQATHVQTHVLLKLLHFIIIVTFHK